MAILKIWDGSAFVEIPILDGVPGGELGGTWASPTVDSTHAGSAHHNNIRYITIRLVPGGTDVAVGAFDDEWVCPFTGTLLQSDSFKNRLSANTDTAGSTGTMVLDIHKGGTTVMDTNKLDIEDGEKSTNTATTQPDLTTTAVTAGDVFTFELDAVHTTEAQGLSVTMAILET